MKKRLISSALITLISLPVIAQGQHGPSGCGLGSEVIFRKAELWHEHVLAATINQSASQTFAMTSGTLGCEDANGPFKHRIISFIDHNIDQLAVDMSKGSGETLDALSELYGMNIDDRSEFNRVVQSNFDQIFTSIELTSGDIYSELRDIITQSATLKKYLS